MRIPWAQRRRSNLNKRDIYENNFKKRMFTLELQKSWLNHVCHSRLARETFWVYQAQVC